MKAGILAFLSTSLMVLQPFVSAQLSGSVGPSTSTAAKAATKTCNILNYGGKASATTDNSAAIASAWAACINGGEGEFCDNDRASTY
jgi:rhamnogalacturonan hydrolase